MSQYLLAIDQGTTSTRAVIFDQDGHNLAQHQLEFQQHFPDNGWVEHDAEEIWQTVLEACRQAMQDAHLTASQIAAIGITNQRETTVIWDKNTGRPIHNAIVWQDRRTAHYCAELKASSHESMIQQKTGLLIDPYFSATKIKWLLDNVPDARARAQAGELAFGTIDSFILWRLTKGRSHKTDATNASRTLIYNIYDHCWDKELLQLMDIPEQILPEVCDCATHFGEVDSEWFGAAIPITGMAGDQQAALVGQACFEPGMVKSTYGTGCFLIMNTGDKALLSRNRLLTTIGYQLQGKVTYALEGSIFIAGAAIQWLRDGLRLIQSASQTEKMAEQTCAEQSVYLVPAFTGLGAPYWDPDARGALLGLTRDTSLEDVVTAGLQSVCYQTADLIHAMQEDGAKLPDKLRVDGGMVVNNWMVQFLADILDVVVDRPAITETTALGAAYLAGLGIGFYSGLDKIAEKWQCERSFKPVMNPETRKQLYAGWIKSVERVRSV